MSDDTTLAGRALCAGMPTPWRVKRDKRGWSGFRIVSVDEACAQTGLTRKQPALQQRGARRTGADAALYSNELLEDEYGEIVALIPVERATQLQGRIEALRLPVVEYAVAIHLGSFENLDRTFAALGTVVAERAIGVQGSIREDYLVGPLETPDETQHRTEIGWPVFQTTPAE